MKMTTLASTATATVAAMIAGPPIASAEPDNSPTMAAHGVEAALAAVPWSQVGPGWMLAMWSPAPGLRPGESRPPGSPTYQTAATTLYLVNPAGGRYAITTFPPPGDGSSPSLVDWSGDGTRALFTTSENGNTVLTQVDLRNGSKTTFTVKGTSPTPRYTRPDGKAVLLTRPHEMADPSKAFRDNPQLPCKVELDYEGVSPMFGGLPATGAIARTATNIRAGAQTPVAGVIHSLTLLAIVLFASHWVRFVPMAVLAGILMVVSYNMGEWLEIPSLL